jgi:solute carrier family 25 (mitochondrial oxoglutarate transporter), member 11
VKEDGAAGLFTGAGPTVVRAMALNMGMLASNDHVGVFQQLSKP